MFCKRCPSNRQQTFNGEIAIHFPGLDGLNKPIVWVFPKLWVCMDCGFAEFAIPERELDVLLRGDPVKGTVVLAGKLIESAPKEQRLNRWSMSKN